MIKYVNFTSFSWYSILECQCKKESIQDKIVIDHYTTTAKNKMEKNCYTSEI